VLSPLLLILALDPTAAKAVEYLVEHVPRWPRENGCFSCHHNGDGARALVAAKRRGYRVPEEALRETLDWLAHPERWDQSAKHPQASDKKLARIQFAVAAREAGLRKGAIGEVPEDAPGGPIVWGKELATALIEKRRLPAPARQNPDGGWGPRNGAPSEAFDTAVALLAVDDRAAIARGRAYLARTQTEDGSWPETTRPAGASSYAHRVSTTAWALLALLDTER